MQKWLSIIIVILLLAAAVAAGVALERTAGSQAEDAENGDSQEDPNDTPPPDQAVVESIEDGDTIVLATGHRIRYIGIRVPTVGPEIQCFGQEAVRANESVEGVIVRLEKEPLLDRSRDGAWMRYVFFTPPPEPSPTPDPDASPEPSPSPSPSPSPFDDAQGKPSAESEDEESNEDTDGEEEGSEEEQAEEEENPDEIMINERIIEGGFGFPVIAEGMVYGERMQAAGRFARATRKGLWGKCEMTEATSGHTITQPIDECTIKGVVTPTGARIYRTSQCTAYATTTVLTTKGGDYFCTEDEAELNGFSIAADCPNYSSPINR